MEDAAYGNQTPLKASKQMMGRRWLITAALRAIVAGAAVAALWAVEWRQRISVAAVERNVAHQMNDSAVRCYEHSENGSSWACGWRAS